MDFDLHDLKAAGLVKYDHKADISKVLSPKASEFGNEVDVALQRRALCCIKSQPATVHGGEVNIIASAEELERWVRESPKQLKAFIDGVTRWHNAERARRQGTGTSKN